MKEMVNRVMSVLEGQDERKRGLMGRGNILMMKMRKEEIEGDDKKEKDKE